MNTRHTCIQIVILVSFTQKALFLPKTLDMYFFDLLLRRNQVLSVDQQVDD